MHLYFLYRAHYYAWHSRVHHAWILTFLFFFEKQLFRYENNDEKSKKSIVFIKIIVSLTIINDDPSLTNFNKERKPN